MTIDEKTQNQDHENSKNTAMPGDRWYTASKICYGAAIATAILSAGLSLYSVTTPGPTTSEVRSHQRFMTISIPYSRIPNIPHEKVTEVTQRKERLETLLESPEYERETRDQFTQLTTIGVGGVGTVLLLMGAGYRTHLRGYQLRRGTNGEQD